MFFDVISYHNTEYPGMRPEDWLKLAFQSEFGCGHAIVDEKSAREAFEREFGELDGKEDEPFYTEIGGGWSRMNLSAVDGRIDRDTAFGIFMKSAVKTGTDEGYKKKATLIADACLAGYVNADPKELLIYFKQNMGKGIPRHSEEYMEKFKPHYRVIKTEYAVFLPLIALAQENERLGMGKGIALYGSEKDKKHASDTLTGMLGEKAVFADGKSAAVKAFVYGNGESAEEDELSENAELPDELPEIGEDVNILDCDIVIAI